MRLKGSKALVTACLLITAGCQSDKFVGRSDLRSVSNQELPPPLREDLILQQRSYVVGPQDRLIVDVYGAPDLSRTAQVDASGVLALPLIGSLPVSGKAPDEIARVVEGRLRGRYIRDPKVTVTLDTANQVVTVDGEVNHPGLYPVVGRMTLIRAVASAQGLTSDANTNYVVVFRQVGGVQYAALYDLRAIRAGQYSDPEVYANDVVSVGETNSRRLFQYAVQAGALLVAPLVTILNR
ncbi:MAG: polysaccharide biosynthesis/export family protein [Janthinobacterium lividum]